MSLLIACALTVGIELAFLAPFGYSDRNAVSIIVWTNVITNLIVNLLFVLLGRRWIAALGLELCVVAAEYAIYACAFGRGWKLFWLTLAANALSFGIGLVLFSPF